MNQYNPPEGYQLDERTGLYYTQTLAEDENGQQAQVVNWFNAKTGEYRQDVYPIVRKTNANTNATPAAKKPAASYNQPQNRTPARAAAPVQASKGGVPVVVWIVGGIVLFLLLIGILVFVLTKRFGKETPDGAEDTQVEEMAQSSEENTEELQSNLITPTPRPTEQPTPEPEAEMTDSVEEAVETEQVSNGENYYKGVSDEEWLRANEAFASLVGMSFFNGEATNGFRFDEASPEKGIYAIWFYYSPFNGEGEYEEVLKCEPLGGRITESGDSFETTVYCEGYNITFIYNFVYGSMDVTSTPVNADLFPLDKNFLPQGDFYNY